MSDPLPVFADAALAALRSTYPERPVLLDHDLGGHPLLSRPALTELALSMRPVDVEYNRADLPVGIDPADIPENGLGIVETLETIDTNGSWMVLKFIEQNPVYREFLHETLAEVAPAVRDVTGEMLKLEGFIFVSSPGAVTPFHMDPEHNILLQIEGAKTMTVFPSADEELVPGPAHEAFHKGGHRNLDWREEFAEKGEAFALTSGKALYVPVKAPHWVQVTEGPALSLSITWQSEWAYREMYAREMNAALRSIGLKPSPPGRFPQQNLAKSFAWRAISKVQRTLKGAA
ncbi:JmjC domain-containing protein [Parasphingopyxis marina]|uniref:Cupin-like domain-containing protein n=1 Tax=Parasphingopyxis marina TaxID=2761622 RepID=A0A842HXU6_9SPHN|nr:cupin domain-containing protein [Parasphingopyxis marina]MBC2778998.1 cupin-like domain-containing protein [Parasphingopyxis marina]